MGLESATFVADLVATNPLFNDQKQQGDDHLRLLKTVLQNTFPGMGGRLGRTQSKSAGYTAVLNDATSVIRFTSPATLALTAAATLGNGWYVVVVNESAGDVTIDPAGTENINDAATLIIPSGYWGFLFCTNVATKEFICLIASRNGLEIQDGLFRISGSVDATKKLAFEVDGFTTGVTRTVTPPNADATLAALNLEDQALTGGVVVTSKNLGTISSGTVTPDPGDRPLQHYINGGAHILAPSANFGSVLVDITNSASAGAITTSGFTKVVGDAFATTNGFKFRCHISIGNGGSLLQVQALQ